MRCIVRLAGLVQGLDRERVDENEIKRMLGLVEPAAPGGGSCDISAKMVRMPPRPDKPAFAMPSAVDVA